MSLTPADPSRAYRISGRWAILVLAFVGLLVLALAYAGAVWTEPILSAAAAAIAFGSAILFVTSFYVPMNAASPSERLRQFLRDADGYPSVALLQFFVWTSVIIFAFTWIAFIRMFSGAPAFAGSLSADLPPNLLAVMGISAGSTIASTKIGALRNGKDGGGQPGDAEPWGTMLEEKNAQGAWRPSLGRFQMLGWTVISVGIYLAILVIAVSQFWNHSSVAALSLPDMDPALLVLMGISHVGYVGSKYVSITSSKGPPEVVPRPSDLTNGSGGPRG